jgi:hypothetical protein
MNDKELLEQIKAKEELEHRGYKWVKCSICDGYGAKITRCEYVPCSVCNGKGYHWEAPITKWKPKKKVYLDTLLLSLLEVNEDADIAIKKLKQWFIHFAVVGLLYRMK